MGTVMGIIRAFEDLGQMGSTSLKAVGPGIAEALITTAVGLFAAIPAAIFYNYFGHLIREIGARMDDFSHGVPQSWPSAASENSRWPSRRTMAADTGSRRRHSSPAHRRN